MDESTSEHRALRMVNKEVSFTSFPSFSSDKRIYSLKSVLLGNVESYFKSFWNMKVDTYMNEGNE